jgi:hypothetical protein
VRGNVDLIAVQIRLSIELITSDNWEQTLGVQFVYTRLVISLKRILKGNEPLVITEGKLGLLHLCVGKSVHWRLESLLKFIYRLWFPVNL